MNSLLTALEALKYLFLIVRALLSAWRQGEAKKEADAKATSRAEEIDRSVADGDLDALRERMHHYQRPGGAL